MTKHCKGCIHHNIGAAGTKYSDWCCKHSTTAKKAKSICILQNSKQLKPTKSIDSVAEKQQIGA